VFIPPALDPAQLAQQLATLQRELAAVAPQTQARAGVRIV